MGSEMCIRDSNRPRELFETRTAVRGVQALATDLWPGQRAARRPIPPGVLKKTPGAGPGPGTSAGICGQIPPGQCPSEIRFASAGDRRSGRFPGRLNAVAGMRLRRGSGFSGGRFLVIVASLFHGRISRQPMANSTPSRFGKILQGLLFALIGIGLLVIAVNLTLDRREFLASAQTADGIVSDLNAGGCLLYTSPSPRDS